MGTEIFGCTILGNENGAIVSDGFGVVIRNNSIGAKKPTGAASQNVGIFLRSDSGGTLVEDNKILNNVDEDGTTCSPAGTLCDLVDRGLDNAGRNNQFTKGFTVPEGFE